MVIACTPHATLRPSRRRIVRPLPRPIPMPRVEFVAAEVEPVDRTPVELLTVALDAYRSAVESGASGSLPVYKVWDQATDWERSNVDRWLQQFDGDLMKSRSGSFCEFVSKAANGVPLPSPIDEFEYLIGMGKMEAARAVARRIVAACPDAAAPLHDEPRPTWQHNYTPAVADDAEVAELFGDEDGPLVFHGLEADRITDADIYPVGCVS